MTTRVLIVDDSRTMLAILKGMLSSDPTIEVVGTACDAVEARAKIKALDPDVVTLDIEMPGMNGLDFLAKIMALRPMPVVVISGLTARGADTSMRALQIGAFDCFAKPDLTLDGDGASVTRLCAMVHAAAASNLPAHRPRASEHKSADAGERAIVIGASTGGVEALSRILTRWPEDCPPTLIVQHISDAFAGALASRLGSDCAAQVVPAETDTFLKPGHVYVAPGGGRHLVLRNAGTPTCRLIEGDPVSGHRPSVDALFRSTAKAMPGRAVGVLLTGMGADGAEGLLTMRRAGCPTIVQDERTSIVFGMPRAAIALGAADHILPIDRIAEKALASCTM
jgi:two-component system, chemotaxis family, protein-glutamate methylesterase/glutaminase